METNLAGGDASKGEKVLLLQFPRWLLTKTAISFQTKTPPLFSPCYEGSV